MRGQLEFCSGCRDDFYNHNGPKECWMLKTSKVVTRFRIPWWTQPTQAGAFTKVTTNSCHYATGVYQHYEKLPTCAHKEAVQP